MYERILVALDASPTDEAIIEHITELAKVHHSHVILLRVAHSHTRDQMTHEIDESEDYVRRVAAQMLDNRVDAEPVVVPGEPVEEIIRQAKERDADLIAMSTHGHKGIQDLIFGSVANEVRHRISIPVLLIRSYRGEGDASSTINEMGKIK